MGLMDQVLVELAGTMKVSAPECNSAPVSVLVRFHARVKSLFAPPVFSVTTEMFRLSMFEFTIVMSLTSNGPPTTFQNSWVK